MAGRQAELGNRRILLLSFGTMMQLHPSPEETCVGVSRALRARKLTCIDVVEQCLARIDIWESRVRAWVSVDRAGALAQARRLDEDLAAGTWRGALHGIPIG